MALNVTISINSYKYPMHICVLWTMADWLDGMKWHGIELPKKTPTNSTYSNQGCLSFFRSKLFISNIFFSSLLSFCSFFCSLSVSSSFSFFSSESLHVCFSKHFYDFSLKENICTKQRKELSKYSIHIYDMELNFSNRRRHCISDIVEKFT